ncbi:hypothetical protein JTB14_019180 [Gonioctena quinquepunctata]|nr:hypothetical protein JTB14_019180 [Gonioctena quinquepunctata]
MLTMMDHKFFQSREEAKYEDDESSPGGDSHTDELSQLADHEYDTVKLFKAPSHAVCVIRTENSIGKKLGRGLRDKQLSTKYSPAI